MSILSFIGWWLIYHGDENPFRIRRELKQKGYHECHPCDNPHHSMNIKDF